MNLGPAAFAITIGLAGALCAQTTVTLLTCSPSRLLPGESATCMVSLSQAAQAGGTEVLLSSTGKSLISSVASLTVPAGGTSATFTVTAASSADETAVLTATALHSVSLSWNASQSPNLSYYNLYRGIVSGGPYPVVTAVGPVTTYTDSNVQAGQTYYYVVTAVDAIGAESTYSNEAAATLPGAAPRTVELSLCPSPQTGIRVLRRCGVAPAGAGRHGN
ncbi:MAG TPA: hypothetical protein VH640_19495 [Bryobacteraceae bacterium]